MKLAGNAVVPGGKWDPSRAAQIAQAWRRCCELDRAALKADTVEAHLAAEKAWHAFYQRAG